MVGFGLISMVNIVFLSWVKVDGVKIGNDGSVGLVRFRQQFQEIDELLFRIGQRHVGRLRQRPGDPKDDGQRHVGHSGNRGCSEQAEQQELPNMVDLRNGRESGLVFHGIVWC